MKTLSEREAVMAEVVERMCGGWTVEEAVRGVEGEFEALGVKSSTVRQWFVAAGPEWQERYRMARVMLGSALAEEAILVARNTSNATAAADRLLVDTLKWKAGKANPREYGEKQVVEHQGEQKLEIVVREEQKPLRNPQLAGQLTAAVVLDHAITAAHLPTKALSTSVQDNVEGA
jgi:hypothetical protein